MVSKRVLTLITLSFFLFSFYAGSNTQSKAASINDPFYTGLTTTDLNNGSEFEYKRTRETGARTTRVLIIWSNVAPQVEPKRWNPSNPNSPSYNWSVYDTQIKQATDAGLTVLAELYHAPSWAERCKAPTSGICNPDPKAFAAFAKAAARRYNGKVLPKVKYWIAWNEPNLHISFMPQRNAKGQPVAPDLYRTLLNRFADSIKAVDKRNQIVAGGLAPNQVRNSNVGPLEFLRRLVCFKPSGPRTPDRSCRSKARFDIWANNPYTSGSPYHNSNGKSDVSLNRLAEVGRVLQAAKKSKKIVIPRSQKVRFWVTEFSWDSNGPDPNGVPMNDLVRWIPEAMYMSWKAGVTNFLWLSMRDWQTDSLTNGVTIESGLYYRGAVPEQDVAKPTLAAFRFPFVAYRRSSGIEVWGRTPSSQPGFVKIYYREDASRAWLLTGIARASKTGVFSKLLKTSNGIGNVGETTAVYTDSSIAAFGNQWSSPAFSLTPTVDYKVKPFG